jgi:hypothetical protein
MCHDPFLQQDWPSAAALDACCIQGDDWAEEVLALACLKPCFASEAVEVTWSWDRSDFGGKCKTAPKTGIASITPGTGPVGVGQKVAECSGTASRGFKSTLYCEIGKSKITSKTTLSAHFVDSDGKENYDGRPVTTGCSTIASKGAKYPDDGKCCFSVRQ